MSGVAEVSSKYLTEIASNPTPLGYKQTEVGMIPKDWEIFSLPEVIWYQEGPGLRKWQFKSKGLKVINVTNLQESGYLDLDRTDRHISWDEFEKTYKHFACDEGDLVIASSGNSYCKASIVRSCDLPLLMNTSVIRFKPIGEFSKGYMEVCLKSPYFKDQIDMLITGGAQPNFGPAHLNLIKIPAPTCAKEQTAIANALSDVDALIGELEKLIAKKQAIKTATMQQLLTLTGRTRLPQFALHKDGSPKGTKPSELGEIPEDWEVDCIGNLISITTGSRNTQDRIEDGTFPFFVRSQTVERINTYSFDGEAVLTAGDGVGTGKIFHYINGKFDFHQRVYLMYNFGDKVDGYFFYIFFSNNFYDRIMSMTAKSSVDSVRREMIADMKMLLPTKEEQTAIATILSDMDTEIQALEQRLGKIRQIKQGMMQELLTGKTRLVQPQEL